MFDIKDFKILYAKIKVRNFNIIIHCLTILDIHIPHYVRRVRGQKIFQNKSTFDAAF